MKTRHSMPRALGLRAAVAFLAGALAVVACSTWPPPVVTGGGRWSVVSAEAPEAGLTSMAALIGWYWTLHGGARDTERPVGMVSTKPKRRIPVYP